MQEFFSIYKDQEIESVINQALQKANIHNVPVVVDVHIDYSKKTRFTQGLVRTVLKNSL